ncbi:MAG: peptidoglycan recognition family protein [Candidatus Gracilibacteria bacterium]|nr:peptidoglycan recognition family protein [Candidatus Gracilibacteria bacterium]MDQ7022474.1 peptidoglycan recognition family protein [Candidatus Gracilibacteria bacterium]
MSKIFSLFLLSFFFFINYSYTNAEEKLRIYSRSEWGANEEYRNINSTYWNNIFLKREKASKIWNQKWSRYSQSKKDSIIYNNKLKSEKKENQNKYLTKYLSSDIKIIEYNKYYGEQKLAWPVGKTEFIKNIVIHHTEYEYKNSWDGIKKIYKYHSLNREWGDIGYNFVIGKNGEIFEGRAGGDYVVGAHDTLNNRSTVGISVIGNFDHSEINKDQYSSLKKLISYLTKKYGIDLNKKIPYHKECFGISCINGLETRYYFPIVGHKDGKATACPGKNIYNDTIPKLIKELQPETKGYKNISYTKSKKQKSEYLEEINIKYNWKKIKINFNKIPEKNKLKIINKLRIINKYELFDWKKEILYKKLYNELK